ncbi:MAG: SpoIID/LytB domain-containing protein [Candidatus Rokubacteria bacterium]|nr:SpoIID/LytB domain-containing protein [Candidatus Rokubacteria bacterium]
MRRRRPRLLVALALGVLVGLAAAPALAGGYIRVALADGIRAVELGGGPLAIQDAGGRPLTAERPTWIRLIPVNGSVEVRGLRVTGLRAGAIRVVSANGGAMRWNGREYPGAIDVRRAADGLLVVNELPLEDYLMGAVKAEAGERMPIEMLKAQAIVARTYAAFHRRLNAGKPYQIVAATAHQQYAGRVGAESPIWAAVRATEGQVLLWEGDLFPAFYHTDSGGHTEDPRAVFAASNMPALRPVRIEFPSESPHHLWALDLPLADLGALLRKGGVSVGRLIALEVLERSVSLRVARIAVRGMSGTVVLRGNDFRRLVGYDTLKSTLFAVAVDGAHARFAGRGYGHGVGMDQASARTMAQLGYSAQQILEYHYPGAAFATLQ